MERDPDRFPAGQYVLIAVLAVAVMAALWWFTRVFNIPPSRA
jgi:hypothetical protein